MRATERPRALREVGYVVEVCPQALLPALWGLRQHHCPEAPQALATPRVSALDTPGVSALPQAQSRGSGCNNPYIHSLCPNRRPSTFFFTFHRPVFKPLILMDLQSKSRIEKNEWRTTPVERQSAPDQVQQQQNAKAISNRESPRAYVHGPVLRLSRTHLVMR